MDAELRLDHSLVALESEGAVFGLLELWAPEAPADAERANLGLALVIDRSGSMAGAKLETAKTCASYLAGRITSADRLGLVAFDDQVSLIAAMQGPGPELGYVLGAIASGGSTNLSGGWLKGLELLEDASASIRRVLLLTDGQANVGITNRDQLASLTASAAERGITTTTIGFGEGFDEDLLSEMADAGRGNDHFAASPEEAPSIFAQEFEGLAAMVAQNLSVEICPVGPTNYVGILNEYPITSTSSGLQAALGDVYGGEERKLVFQIQALARSALGEVKVAEVVIRWTDIGAGSVKMHTRTIPVKVNVVTGPEAAGQTTDSEVTEQVVILDAAKARKEARKLADEGDFDGARGLLSEQTEKLRAIPEASQLFDLAAEDIDQLERFSHRLEVQAYDRLDSKALLEQSRRRHRSQDYRKRPERES